MMTLSKVISFDHMVKLSAEFNRLQDKCYLDNAGTALYPQRLLRDVNEDLLNNVYMNPHTDKYTKDCIENIRCLILKHFNTDASKYTVIFTSGTTQSLKLVTESFQFTSDDDANCGSFVYLQDNHTSVLGLREIVKDKDVDIVHVSHQDFLQSLNSKQTSKKTWKESSRRDGNTLLAYPAQSNFNGFKYPIDVIDKIKSGCLNNYIIRQLCEINCNWYVLLDAASYVATNKLDLSNSHPDFVCLSFYKLFGYPTGLGALLVKNTSAHVLSQKRYFGGGTVDVVLSNKDFHVKRQNLCERFEDGTLSFLAIVALKHCFDVFNKLIPKVVNDDLMETISHHSFYLAKDLFEQLIKLRHSNGKKAVVLYMDSDFSDIKHQGGIVTFNLLREDESFIGYSEFQHMADLFNINVRTGCFCNSGSCQRHLNASDKDIQEMYKAGHKCGDEVDLVHGRPTGAIRVSFSYYNTYKDVDKLISMICRCFVTSNLKLQNCSMNIYKNLDVTKHNEIKNDLCKNRLQNKSYFKHIDVIDDDPMIKSNISLKEIAIFPVKSCGAFKIKSSWEICSKGLKYDRDWMIINENGVCLTQKQNTRMCMLQPKVDLRQKLLILNFKGKNPISIPLEETRDNQINASLCHSKVCSDLVKGHDCGDDVANWISEALETSFLRLIRQSETDTRAQKNKLNGESKMLSLSNQAQFLLINTATAQWLKDNIQDVTFVDSLECLTDRFRGNLIIEMEEELVETRWNKLVIGKHEFKVEGQCTRCQMVCIDQQTGEKTVEPLRTISQKFFGKMRFGIYLSYVGTTDSSDNYILKVNSPVEAFSDDVELKR